MGFYFAGAVMIIWGIKIMIDPTGFNTKTLMRYDYSGYNIPLGIVGIAVGVLLIWSQYRKKKKEP